MSPRTVFLDGKRYVILPGDEYDRLAKAAALPPSPDADEQGNYPTLEYGRVSLARKIILRRQALGPSQAELARRAGVRAETLCRIESGRHTPTVVSIEKIDRALTAAEQAGSARE